MEWVLLHPRAGHPKASSVPGWAEQARSARLSKWEWVLAQAGAFLCRCGSRTMPQLDLNGLVALPLGKGHSSCLQVQPAPCLARICPPGAKWGGLESRHSAKPEGAAGCCSEVVQAQPPQLQPGMSVGEGLPRLVAPIGITEFSPGTRRMAVQCFFLDLGQVRLGHAMPN